MLSRAALLAAAACLFSFSSAAIIANETTSTISVANGRLDIRLSKSSGAINYLRFDGTDLLGTGTTYLDCYCIPSGFYTPGSTAPSYSLITGIDSTNTSYAGIVLTETYRPTGQLFQQHWYIRDGETGIHGFSRLAYYNTTTPFLRNLQEFRTLFRPSTALWTHLSTNEKQWAPLPSKEAVSKQIVVQDATWSFKNTPNDKYFQQESEFFTKYTFSDQWLDLKAHGLYADGSTSNGTAFGAWTIMNTRETYFGGPLHSDLTVDGIVYNYISSNHHGNGVPNITNGFDRTFGPHVYYFNTGKNTSLSTLRADAESLLSPSAASPASQWPAFYDSLASKSLVPNLVPSSSRGTFSLQLSINAKKNSQTDGRTIAILSASGFDFQDNAADVKAYQYWADVAADGTISIPRVKAGTYRLTVYKYGVFGQYTKDGIVVKAGKTTTTKVTWTPESAGTEIWRIGTPDKSSGEFRHGDTPDPTHPLHPAEYRIFWGAYNFVDDFPTGVNYTIGKSDITKDWNYVHWNLFGPNSEFNKTVVNGVNEWAINFDLPTSQTLKGKTATLTVQLAGAKTASGNTDVPNGDYSNMDLTLLVNPKTSQSTPLNWTIEWYQSSSCAVRSAVSCYNIAHKYTFPATWLQTVSNATAPLNSLVLSLPYNATDLETAILPGALYVQYDALRLEIS